MSDHPDDTWPQPLYKSAPPKQLHALGVISLNFNLLEASLYVLLEQFMPPSAVAHFFHEMSNEKRLHALRQFSESNADPDVAERVEAVCNYFAICAENRNLLMHSRIDRLRSEDHISLTKMGKRGSFRFDVPIESLRRIADEMWRGIEFTFGFAEYLEAMKKLRNHWVIY
jgi:hypothetical protein